MEKVFFSSEAKVRVTKLWMFLLAGIICTRWQKLAKIGQNIKTTRSRRKRGNQDHQLRMQEMKVNIQKINFSGKQSSFKNIKYLI